MNSPALKGLLLSAVLIAGFAGVRRVQRGIDSQLAALYQEDDVLVLHSAATVKAMSLEYAPLVADLYWTRVVQYYGEKFDRGDVSFPMLWPLLDITTTLDPNLIVAYRFGATFLAEPPPRGAGNPDRAVELLDRGIRANPSAWRLYEDLGFVYYFNLKDYPKASAAFLEGSKNPEAGAWMKVLAAKVSEQGPTRETSLFLWNDIYNSSTDPQMKHNALTHLRLLRAQTDCEQLDVLAAEYQKRTARRPATLRELVNAGLLPGPAVDPLGFTYVFNAEGKAQLNPKSPLFKDQPLYQRSF
jgi:tetratricopeptide (TPR) repeat protein